MTYLTEEFVAKLPAKAKAYKVTDEVKRGKGCVGLCVRVTPAGAKTYALQYRTPTGKGWLKIGPCDSLPLELAREIGQKHRGDIAKGLDPARKVREDRKASSVDDLIDKFMKDYLPQKADSTAKEYERILIKHVRPTLGKRLVKELGTSDIASLLDDIRKNSGPVQANRVRSVLSKMFSKAELWEMGREPETNPVRGQDRTQERKRERRMSELEIRHLGEALRDKETIRKESVYALAAIRLAILAGFRRGELLGMVWAWVDLENGEVRIPAEAHKTGRKTGKTRVVHLCAAAVETLRALPRDARNDAIENPFVFAGRLHLTSLVQLQDVWERIRDTVTATAKVEAAKSKTKNAKPAVDISDVHIHDLRRTFSSVGADMGMPELFLSALLGHSAGTTTQGYTRVGHNPLKETVEQIGSQIAAWLDGSQ